MNPAQIRNVRSLYRSVAADRERAAALFFASLFELDPGLRRLFAGDLVRLGVKLIHGAGLVVEDFHRLHVFIPALEALAARLAGRGLQRCDYALIGEAVARAARALLGPDFTVDRESALAAAWREVSGVMIAAGPLELRLAA